MSAAPGTVLNDFHLVGGRVLLHVFRIVGEVSLLAVLDVVQGACQCHVPITMMVTIRLPVCCYVDELGLFPVWKNANQPLSKAFAVV